MYIDELQVIDDITLCLLYSASPFYHNSFHVRLMLAKRKQRWHYNKYPPQYGLIEYVELRFGCNVYRDYPPEPPKPEPYEELNFDSDIEKALYPWLFRELKLTVIDK